MRALKILVAVMGVMLVVGFVALVVAVAERMSKKEPLRTAPPVAGQPVAGQPVAGQPMAGQPVAGQPVTAAPIELPRGAHIDGMAVGPDRVVLDLGLADNEHRLLVIDMATGRTLVTIPLHSAP